MKKKLFLMVALFVMLLLLISCGVSQSKLDEQINGETAKADVMGLEVNYPTEWQATDNGSSTSIVFQNKDKWVAEEEITYVRESEEAADISEFFSSFSSDAIDSGSISADGITGDYIVTNKKVTDKDDEVTSYLAAFKLGNSIFNYSYSTSSKLFDKSQAESLLGLVNAAAYKSPEVSDYKMSYSAEAVNGLETSKIQEGAELKRVYSNGYEEAVEKDAWKISKPKKLTAPTTTLTVSVDDKDVEIDISDIGYKHYSDFPGLIDFGNFSGIEPSNTSNSGMFSYNNGIQDKQFIEYYDMSYTYPITKENAHFIEEYYQAIQKEGISDSTSGDHPFHHFYYHSDQSDEAHLFMIIRDDNEFTIYRTTDKSPF